MRIRMTEAHTYVHLGEPRRFDKGEEVDSPSAHLLADARGKYTVLDPEPSTPPAAQHVPGPHEKPDPPKPIEPPLPPVKGKGKSK